MKLDLSRFAQVAGAPAHLHCDAFPPETARHLELALTTAVMEYGKVIDTHAEGQLAAGSTRARYVMRVERAPWSPASYQPLPGMGGELDSWSPVVALLAGHLVNLTGVAPDLVALNLYRDGRDFLPWHIDSASLGPTAAEMFVATYSFGATRSVAWRPIGQLGPETCALRTPSNSVYVMDLDCQRRFAHRVLPEPQAEVGPRVSVAFFVRQRDTWHERQWVAIHAQDGALAVGTHEQMLELLVAQDARIEALDELERRRWKARAETPEADRIVVIGPTGEVFLDTADLRRWLFGRGLIDSPDAPESPEDARKAAEALGDAFADVAARGETTALARTDEYPASEIKRLRRA